jgi:hypothetical protein
MIWPPHPEPRHPKT